jgi:hypothetical protein
MFTIEEILSELLLQHSCVIIPKFGGFVAKQASAKIDLERNLIIPPSKHLLFNKHLITNDGLLVNELAIKNNTSFVESEKRVSQFVEEMNTQLKNAKEYNLPRIGVFQIDSEGNINFEQDRHFNLLLNAYGLTSIQFVSKTQVEKVEKEIEKEKDTPIVPIHQSKRNLWRYAAAACLLPIAFYSIWIPAKTDVLESGLISHRDFNPFYKQEEGSYEKKPLKLFKETRSNTFEEKLVQKPDSYFAEFNLDPDHSFTVRMQHKSAPEQITNQEPILVETVKPVAPITDVEITKVSRNYEYVLGCFANKLNADNLCEKLKSAGFEVNKSSAGSLIRVSIGGTNDMDSLQKVISKANNMGYQGWILKN